MTKEERLDWLCRLRSWIPIYIPRNKAQFEEALSEEIKALSELDDIRAEIADMDGDINGFYVHKDDVLAIIDKHIRGKADETDN